MKKRYLIFAAAVLALVAFAIPAAFAENADNPAKAWFDQMFANKKAYVDEAVKNGRLTEEQGQAYKEHFDQMYKWHEQNNFNCPMGGPGVGAGFGRGMGCRGGLGWGPGAMGGFNQAPTAQQ
ncbi:DUF2680 domain-containing protein [Desulfolucanica intricata]|uniref:DUF2680 domain-containing protein n=1 Tax=Desulfolucanica intricata TaxID=1285191 RepID=UPI00082F1731|nr:DUF2680 domain-containing protein [Desulfolucanica intricata]